MVTGLKKNRCVRVAIETQQTRYGLGLQDSRLLSNIKSFRE